MAEILLLILQYYVHNGALCPLLLMKKWFSVYHTRCCMHITLKKERIVLREIHLRTTGLHLSMGSHSVICYPTEVTAPPSPKPGRLVLDLSTP